MPLNDSGTARLPRLQRGLRGGRQLLPKVRDVRRSATRDAAREDNRGAADAFRTGTCGTASSCEESGHGPCDRHRTSDWREHRREVPGDAGNPAGGQRYALKAGTPATNAGTLPRSGGWYAGGGRGERDGAYSPRMDSAKLTYDMAKHAIGVPLETVARMFSEGRGRQRGGLWGTSCL